MGNLSGLYCCIFKDLYRRVILKNPFSYIKACPLTKSNLQALDFVINRFFMRLFKTTSIETVKHCQEFFGFDLPSVLWAKRMHKFELKFGVYMLSA